MSDSLSSLWSSVSNMFGGGESAPNSQYGWDVNETEPYINAGSSSGSSGGDSFNWGNMLGGVAKNALPLALLASSFGGGSGNKQTGMTATTYTPYYQSPSQTNQGIAGAGAARTAAFDDLTRQLSVRGIGPNSPYSTGKASGIQRQYLSNLSNIYNKANTPIGFNTNTNTTQTGGGTNNLAYALALMSTMNNKNNNGLFNLSSLFGG